MIVPITVERTYNAPADIVWQAITDKDQMKQWYFDLPEFKPEVGFAFSFEGGKEDRIYIHHCRIIEVVPGRKLKHTWVYEGYEGESFVTFELFPEGDLTRIILTHAGLETFPPLADFHRDNFQEGWSDIIGRSLKEFVEKQ